MAEDRGLLNPDIWRNCVNDYIEYKLELQHLENGEKEYRKVLAEKLPERWGGYFVVGNKTRLKIYDWLKTNDIQQPQKRDIRQYISYLKENSASAATIRKQFYIIRDFFRFLDGESIYPNNVKELEAYKVKGEKIHKREYMTAELFQRLISVIDHSSAKGARDMAIVSLAFMRGLRIGSIVTLRLKDFIYNKTDDYYQIFVTVKKMRNEPEWMRIPKPAGAAIQKYLELLQVDKIELKPHHPLFVSFKPGYKTKGLNVSSVSHIVKGYYRALAARGIIDDSQLHLLCAHSFRHGFVSEIRKKHDRRKTRELTGHGSDTALEPYDNTINRKALERDIDDMFTNIFADTPGNNTKNDDK